ncbi:MAG TPA: AAA family ATPase, partial [Candidatus Woesebacteria bacterium]|nr:AAA family ATPase [Candidatus Woesebacteria bacterium]
LLFAGPKGTGKTSAARIIGAMLNDPINQKVIEQTFFQQLPSKQALQEPSLTQPLAENIFQGRSSLVQEMDAASNRGIDDIRLLKERVYLLPQQGSISVFILDEVHMLTNEAFNALLKILEEPPAHVVFILATTELHKLPATIISRCNLVTFSKASQHEISKRLQKILELEKVPFEDDALLEIATRADGSFRDAVKLAEIVAIKGKIGLSQIEQLIGGSILVDVKKVIELVLGKNEVELAKLFEQFRQRNLEEAAFLRTFFGYLHQQLLAGLGVEDVQPSLELKVSQYLLTQVSKMDLRQTTPIPFLPLELLLLSIIQKAKSGDSSGGSKRNNDASQQSPSRKKLQNKPSSASSQEPAVGESKKIIIENDSFQDFSASSLGGSLSSILCQHWAEFLNLVEAQNPTLAALLRSSQPQAGPNGTAQVNVYYRFHQEQLQQPKLLQIIEECGSKVVGNKIAFQFALVEPPVNGEVIDVAPQSSSLELIAQEVLT